MLPNKQQIRITNLSIKAYIDEKFTQLIRIRNASIIDPVKRYRKRLLIEAWRKMFILRGRSPMQKGFGPYLNSGTAAVTVLYNPLKFVSPGQNVQNLYYYSHYSGPGTCLMGRSAIAEVASK